MTTFEDRKSAFEEKFAHDEEMQFKAEARACKLFGLWLAPQLGLDGANAEAYAQDVVAANLEEPGFEDVVRFAMPAIEEKGLHISAHQVETQMNHFFDEAKAQIMSEQDAA